MTLGVSNRLLFFLKKKKKKKLIRKWDQELLFRRGRGSGVSGEASQQEGLDPTDPESDADSHELRDLHIELDELLDGVGDADNAARVLSVSSAVFCSHMADLCS